MASIPRLVRSIPAGAAASTLTASGAKSVVTHSSHLPSLQSATYFFPTPRLVMAMAALLRIGNHPWLRGSWTPPKAARIGRSLDEPPSGASDLAVRADPARPVLVMSRSIILRRDSRVGGSD